MNVVPCLSPFSLPTSCRLWFVAFLVEEPSEKVAKISYVTVNSFPTPARSLSGAKNS